MFETGRSTDTAPPTDNYGNVFVKHGSDSGYDGFGTTWTFKAYAAENGVGGSGHTLTKLKPTDPTGEIVIGLVEVTDSARLVGFSQDYAHSPAANTSRPVHVDGPATLVAIWSGDSPSTHNTATPGNGFSTIENYTDWPVGTSIETAVATKEVTTAGYYGITWSVSPTQGANLYLFAFAHTQIASAADASGSQANSASGNLVTGFAPPASGSQATSKRGH
jgi:hypothetical protein